MSANIFRRMFVWIIIMLEYDRIDILEGIDVDKTDKSKECMFCQNWYFLNKNFKYGQYLCDGCYDIVQKSIYILNKKSYKKQRKRIL